MMKLLSRIADQFEPRFCTAEIAVGEAGVGNLPLVYVPSVDVKFP